MKTLIIAAAVLVLYSTVAFAGVLPITGKYCDMSGAGVIVDADGVWSEDDYPFAKVLKSGPDWWEVSYKDIYNSGITSRIALSADKTTVTVKDSDQSESYTLHRCPD